MWYFAAFIAGMLTATLGLIGLFVWLDREELPGAPMRIEP